MASVPWVNGTVHAVAAELRSSAARSTDDIDGMMRAAVVGMISGLTRHDTRPAAARLGDIDTVLKAFEVVEQEMRS